jgi:ubiquinone/menaquinone biosynthesis C-methylase UbiE
MDLVGIPKTVLTTIQHHHIYNMVLNGQLYRAPISDEVERILDLGTGTGSWAIDVAEYMALCFFGTLTDSIVQQASPDPSHW